jgi:hypothetical protein
MYAQDYYNEYDSGEASVTNDTSVKNDTSVANETNVNKTPGAAETGHDYYYEYDSGKTDEKETAEAGKDGVFYTLGYGAAASWLIRQRTATETITEGEGDEEGQPVTRTVKRILTYRDFFPGLYLNFEFYNVKNPIKDMSVDIIPQIRLAAYYPLDFFSDTSTINKEPRRSEDPSHFGIDMLAGIKLELMDYDYVRVNITPALHMLYLSSDSWNYFDLGAAVTLGIEMPLNERWTFLVNGCVSIDSGNLGSNRDNESFDSCSQYQVDIGFRYSIKKPNEFSLFGDKKPKEDTKVEYDEYE